MEAPENGDSRGMTRGLARTGNRLQLPESLVRTRLVVEAYELGDRAAEVALAHEENVVEQLPAEGAREPFGERVHVRRPGRNPHDLRPRRVLVKSNRPADADRPAGFGAALEPVWGPRFNASR